LDSANPDTKTEAVQMKTDSTFLLVTLWLLAVFQSLKTYQLAENNVVVRFEGNAPNRRRRKFLPSPLKRDSNWRKNIRFPGSAG
jgi:hypothetical protein